MDYLFDLPELEPKAGVVGKDRTDTWKISKILLSATVASREGLLIIPRSHKDGCNRRWRSLSRWLRSLYDSGMS